MTDVLLCHITYVSALVMFADASGQQFAHTTAHRRIDWRTEKFQWLSSEAIDFLQRLLDGRPRIRFSAAQALKHPFMVGEPQCSPSAIGSPKPAKGKLPVIELSNVSQLSSTMQGCLS